MPNEVDNTQSVKSLYPAISLGDLYAGACVVCGDRAEWGTSNLNGPDGCRDAIKAGRVFCINHLSEKFVRAANS